MPNSTLHDEETLGPSLSQEDRSSEQLQLALECADMGFWSYDPVSRMVTTDTRVQQIFRDPRAFGPVDFWLNLLIPEDRERVAQHFEGAMEGRHPYDLEYRIQRADGERWVRSKGRIIGRPPTRMFALIEDITDRKRTEIELRASEEGMHMAQVAAGIASWDWNVATGELKWHPKGTLVYGRPSDQLADFESVLSFVHEEDRDKLREEVKSALEGRGEFKADFRVVWPDGSIHHLLGRGQPLWDKGQVSRIAGVNMDITERHKSEVTQRQNEKLAAVGRLASSIAHEINNPLESVTNLLYLVRSSSSLDDIQEYAETAERELRRVALIANQTLKFRKQSTRPAPFYCHDLIGDSLLVYQGRLVNRHVTVEKRKRATQPIPCLGEEIRQVLNNLIGNAIDSMPNGGRLLVRSRDAVDWTTGRQGVVLTVADTGTGMSKATQKKIFDAFFSTKGIGGTGLGLWLSQEIVHRHQGTLRVRSCEVEDRSGTVFTLFLPV